MKIAYGPGPFASTVTDATGGVHRYHGNALGLVERYVDPLGRATRLAYDAGGHLVSVQDAMGYVDHTRHDAMGRPLTSTDVLGRQLRFRRDPQGNAIELVDPAGAVWKMEHDAAGRLVQRTDPSGAVTRCEYNARGRAVRTSGPGGTEETRYDAHANLIERIGVRGETWRYTWDLLGLPVRLETPTGAAYALSYDSRGEIVEVVGPHGRRTERQFDARRRVVAERHPGGGVTTSRFVGEALVERSFADGSRLRWGYDAMLRPVWIENAAGERHLFDYDAAGQLVREQTFAGHEHRYEYDLLGRCVARTGADGRALRRGKGGVIEQLTVHGEGGVIEQALAFEHGPEEVVRRLDRRTGVAITRDRLGRPVRVRAIGEGGASIRERAFEWAPQPGVATVVDSAHGRRSYHLDASGRVRRASGLGVEEKYDHAAQGTPIAGSEGAASVGRGGRKRTTGSARFVWDASGRLAQRLSGSPASSWTYVYDGESRLSEARRHDGFMIRFVYDAFGRRLALLRSDGTSTWFGWDGDSVVEERPGAGHAVRRVFREDGYTPIAEHEGEAGWRLVATDAASTPWLYLSADGAVASLDLDPLGNEVRVEGRVGLLRFAGQRADVETGLRYNRHRYYSPELGTFLTPDPLGQAGSVHDIGFVPNATEYIDPLGLIIIIGYTANDDHPDEHGRGETRRAAMERAAATGQQVVRADQLRGPHNPGGLSLEGETHVEVVTHGSTRGGQVTFQNGQRNWSSGRQLGEALNQAGLQPGSEVVVVACNASTTPTERPRQSVIAGVNQATGCPTSGPSGIAYVRPYGQQYCGVCPPTPGAGGSVDLTDGQWDRATGPRGGTPTVSQVSTPSTQHADSWHDPTAPTGRGSHGGFPGVPHQD
ncbi:RHS repeat-associated core domain-containing protein [Sorangium sp. So ce321]|uniref:RHS repeat-associated core domain-containing protein n=1 Tax=Sorangium sp. So ce321 TaxID=3133300 RepID=UPI003F5FD126